VPLFVTERCAPNGGSIGCEAMEKRGKRRGKWESEKEQNAHERFGGVRD